MKQSRSIILRPATQTDAAFVWRATALSEGDEYLSGRSASRKNDARREYFLKRFDPGLFRIVTLGRRQAGLCRIQQTRSEMQIDRIEILPGFQSPDAPPALESAVIARLQEEARSNGWILRIQAPREETFRRLCESLGFAAEKAMSRRLLMRDCAAEDERWMREAIAQARQAGEQGESPVGAVLVRDGRLLARGRNACLTASDPTAHAEILAIRAAATSLKEQRLEGCALYVTVEPCAMCCGAMMHARIARLVFGARNEKFGACGSQCDLLSLKAWNHRVAWRGGVLARECAAPLKEFFHQKRLSKA
ncbi:MAG: tRNA adenosine(34) deaminase TadA [Candidatus Sumerlaeota bacterium]|nr:tRNA adenosine(34) deaminase TadA [Candidatus Sumerlaeota bacterium]